MEQVPVRRMFGRVEVLAAKATLQKQVEPV